LHPASASNCITTLSVEKNEQDVAVLQKIIATQSGKNTTISENLNDSKQYTWENGRLVGINWSDEDNIYTGGRGMTGAISFAGLSALKQLNCSGNSITALDVSGNTRSKLVSPVLLQRKVFNALFLLTSNL